MTIGETVKQDPPANHRRRRILVHLEPGLEPGGMLLLHDADHRAAPGSWARTAQSLELLLTALDGRSLPAVRVRPTC